MLGSLWMRTYYFYYRIYLTRLSSLNMVKCPLERGHFFVPFEQDENYSNGLISYYFFTISPAQKSRYFAD
jgi:hypothetical protein